MSCPCPPPKNGNGCPCNELMFVLTSENNNEVITNSKSNYSFVNSEIKNNGLKVEFTVNPNQNYNRNQIYTDYVTLTINNGEELIIPFHVKQNDAGKLTIIGPNLED